MARFDVPLLDTNDPFPEMELQLLNGKRFKIPEAFGEGYAVFLTYRGHW
ncbi:MAG: hypothetical protein K9N10_18825 [Deltaproteobacteria bacterium]|nr:hypothetical protein [Deltaproteobacteria bacterium]